MRLRFLFSAAALLLCCAISSQASARLIQVSITNDGNSSFYLTPTWVGFHDGSFNLFTPGSAASSGLEMLAEDGIVSGVQSEFTAAAATGNQSVLANPAGFPGAPIIDPGETASIIFDVDSSANRFFNFASMVIPSNDSFIGNGMGLEVFDNSGNVNGGTFTFSVSAEQIWDAGTEVNDTFGAAFSNVGGTATDENGTVELLGIGGLDNFLNTTTPANTITDLFTAGESVATISITAVPEPSSLAVLGLAGLGLVLRRKRS